MLGRRANISPCTLPQERIRSVPAVLSYSCLIMCKVLHPYSRKTATFSFRAAQDGHLHSHSKTCAVHLTGQLFLWREGAIIKQMPPVLILILAPSTHPSTTFPSELSSFPQTCQPLSFQGTFPLSLGAPHSIHQHPQSLSPLQVMFLPHFGKSRSWLDFSSLVTCSLLSSPLI